MQEMLAKLERAEKEKELLQQKLEETNNNASNKREESNTNNENLTIWPDQTESILIFLTTISFLEVSSRIISDLLRSHDK